MFIGAWCFILGFAALCVSCNKEELRYNPADWVKLYMPQAINNPVEHPLVMRDSAQSIVYGAAYAGTTYPATDITVTFQAKPDKVADFNAQHGTDYKVLPADSYTFQSSAIIPAGKDNSAPLHLQIKTIGALEPLVNYLLPLSLVQAGDNLTINPTLQTSYFLIRGEYKRFDRSAWKIVDFSTQNGQEGSANERVENALDGDINTFWHSQYQGDRPGPPHFLTFDMNKLQQVHGVSFSARRNAANGQFKRVRVELSQDGQNWQLAGSFELANALENTVYLASNMEGRYIRIWIDEAYGNITCSLAELNVF
ncbi:discoidin domain-containing protein [Olivibacter ginsenosidimutans]|uniref:Discoidin domain-containing protein n=2 Tax=Olivibacter ginsenosidimutans TaxID=1176537 RepID=A0ABP9BX00_9SPHI